MMTPNDAMKNMMAKAQELANIMNQAERMGYSPRVEFDWVPGLSALLQTTKVWRGKVTVNGITNETKDLY